jgi:hypothetical protein
MAKAQAAVDLWRQPRPACLAYHGKLARALCVQCRPVRHGSYHIWALRWLLLDLIVLGGDLWWWLLCCIYVSFVSSLLTTLLPYYLALDGGRVSHLSLSHSDIPRLYQYLALATLYYELYCIPTHRIKLNLERGCVARYE